jgi:selenocysteine-specific translation elongation factor
MLKFIYNIKLLHYMDYTILTIMDQDMLKKIAKKSSETDIEYYHSKMDDKIFTFLNPVKFPERIAPLLMAGSVSDAAIVQVNSIDRTLGEIILGLDSLNLNNVLFLVPQENVDSFKPLIKNTKLQDSKIAEPNIENISAFLSDLKRENVPQGEGYIVVDQSFSVKGVGTVALGFVKEGRIQKHMECRVYPSPKMSEIKSIQVQDVDVEYADVGTRVGVALRGVNPDDVPRGSILASHERFSTSVSFRMKVRKNPIIKDSLGVNSKVTLYMDFGRYSSTISDVAGDKILFDFENDVTITNDVYVISHQDRPPRVYGSGIVIR